MSKKKVEDKNIITNRQAFDLGEALANPSIRDIKTSGFGITVLKNFDEIKKYYDAFHKKYEPSKKFTAMLELADVKTNDDYEALRENPDYLPLVEARDKQMEAYNKALLEPFPGEIRKIRLNNTTLGISANEIDSIRLMLDF